MNEEQVLNEFTETVPEIYGAILLSGERFYISGHLEQMDPAGLRMGVELLMKNVKLASVHFDDIERHSVIFDQSIILAIQVGKGDINKWLFILYDKTINQSLLDHSLKIYVDSLQEATEAS